MTRPFSAVTSPLTRPLTMTSPSNANTQSCTTPLTRNVAVEDQHPVDRLAAADVDAAGDHDLVIAVGPDVRREAGDAPSATSAATNRNAVTLANVRTTTSRAGCISMAVG